MSVTNEVLPSATRDSLFDNCSEVSTLVARDFLDKIYVIAFDAEDLQNQMLFLKDVANWLSDNVKP